MRGHNQRLLKSSSKVKKEVVKEKKERKRPKKKKKKRNKREGGVLRKPSIRSACGGWWPRQQSNAHRGASVSYIYQGLPFILYSVHSTEYTVDFTLDNVFRSRH